MFAKKLRVVNRTLLQSTRHLRSRGTKIKLPETSFRSETEIATSRQPHRNPLEILRKDKFIQEPLTSADFKVSELKNPIEQPKKEKKVLGKDVAGKIRLDKRQSQAHSTPRNVLDVFGVHDFSRLGHVELAKLLRKQVIYADEDLVILNKPYGLVAHDGDGMKISLSSCLPIVSKMVYGLKTSVPLVICNRLDKGTTGITVCAANKDVGRKIVTLFRQQKIRKKYWAITVGSPVPRQGIIDIPMTMRQVEARKKGRSHAKMALNPEQKVEYESGEMVDFKPRNTQHAITHYRTLDCNEGLTLLELQPLTTVKHQLRVHTSEGLGCPILGDHKYSRSDDLSPQSLPPNVLRMLRLKRTRSRDVPMHLHLREIIIPEILDNAQEPNLLISAKFSSHMFHTTKLFKLKPGVETDFKYPTRLKPKPKSRPKDPNLEKLYTDPFAEENPTKKDELQRDDCHAIYKPKVKVKFQYGNS